MLQRTAGTFIAKKIKDELFSPPAAERNDEEEERHVPQPSRQRYDDPQDGAEFLDENGRVIGYTRRLHDVAVYAVTSAHGSPHAALSEALRDPNSQLVFQSANGRITGLIYAPDPEHRSAGSSDTRGFRSDEV